LLDGLNGAKYFSLIDLNSKYYQIRIMDEDVEKWQRGPGMVLMSS